MRRWRPLRGTSIRVGYQTQHDSTLLPVDLKSLPLVGRLEPHSFLLPEALSSVAVADEEIGELGICPALCDPGQVVEELPLWVGSEVDLCEFLDVQVGEECDPLLVVAPSRI